MSKIEVIADQEKTVWMAETNTCLTEGRGYQYVYAVAESKEAAMRIGKGRYVQGSDCPVRAVAAFLIGGRWFAPSYIHPETKDDAAKRKEREEREKIAEDIATVIERARIIGLSQEDIDVLSKAKL